MTTPTTQDGAAGGAARPPVGGWRDAACGDARVADFTQRRIEHALHQRVRYRYVQPHVVREPEGYRIESPCCSRNVDPAGGPIDIAWLAQDVAGRWHLHAREHARHRWVEQCASGDLAVLLDLLCVDAARVFWP